MLHNSHIWVSIETCANIEKRLGEFAVPHMRFALAMIQSRNQISSLYQSSVGLRHMACNARAIPAAWWGGLVLPKICPTFAGLLRP
jgi:hypothetical protein